MLLSGVTLITHGYQPASSDRPSWLDSMAAAIVDKAGDDTAVYALRIQRSGSTLASSLSFLGGLSPTSAASDNAESVVMLDWADASGVMPWSYWNTSTIAAVAAPYLLSAFPNIGLTSPLAESPIHLVGHSRGGSVVSELALDFAKQGVWVDQLTTLDPHPVFSDPSVSVWDNIWFADNYYQTADLLAGTSVEGSHNVNLSTLVPSHTGVHTYYHGTIDTDATAVDGVAISGNWYSTAPTGPRDEVGYDWSRIGSGERPADGVWYSASHREPTTVTATGSAVWDNIVLMDFLDPLSVVRGQTFQVNMCFDDSNRDATLSVGFDLDTNPYNGTFASLSEGPSTSTAGLWSPILDTDAVAPGTYHVYAKITNGTHTRYYYAPGEVTITPAIIPGDVNRDGNVNALDISAFVDYLIHLTYLPEADLNADGAINALDIKPFVDILVSHNPALAAAPATGGSAVNTFLSRSPLAGYAVAAMDAGAAIDQSVPLVTVKATRATAGETQSGTRGIGQFTFTRAGSSVTESLTVNYTLGGTAADDGSDYAVSGIAGSVTFAAGASKAIVTITPVDDAIAEERETVVLTLVPADEYRLGTAAQQTAVVTIADNEPTVYAYASRRRASERDANNTGSGQFKIMRKGGNLSAPLTVTYGVAGSATPGDDYAALSGSVTIGAGFTTAYINVVPVDDLVTEALETIILSISAASAYHVGLLKAPPAVSLRDWEIAPDTAGNLLGRARVSTGSAPFAPWGAFQFALSSGGDQYLLLGDGMFIDSSFGSCTYEKTASDEAVLSFGDSEAGLGEGYLHFLKPNYATFEFIGSDGGFQRGAMSFVVPAGEFAPLSMAGRSVHASVGTGGVPLANWGSYDLHLGQSEYDLIPASLGVAASSGTYTYLRFSSTIALVSFTDDLLGEGFMALQFVTSTRANYWMTSMDLGGWQRGTALVA